MSASPDYLALFVFELSNFMLMVLLLNQNNCEQPPYLSVPVPEGPVLGKVSVASSKNNVAVVHNSED